MFYIVFWQHCQWNYFFFNFNDSAEKSRRCKKIPYFLWKHINREWTLMWCISVSTIYWGTYVCTCGHRNIFPSKQKTSSKFCVGYILYIVVIASRKNDLQEKLCFVQHKKIVAFKSKQRYNKNAINSKHLLQISSILISNFNKIHNKHRNIKTLWHNIILEMQMVLLCRNFDDNVYETI